MSERGQKIFKIVTCIVLIIILGTIIWKTVNFFVNPSIKMDEWVTMLNESLELDLVVENGNETVTGKKAVDTSFESINDIRLQALYVANQIENNSVYELAVNKELLTKKQLSKGLTKREAEEYLDKYVDFYFDSTSYPNMQTITFHENVVNATNAIIKDHDDDYLSCTLSECLPEENKIIIIETEDGEQIARRVISAKENEDGFHSVKLELVENIEDVIDEITFCGSAVLNDELLEVNNDFGSVSIRENYQILTKQKNFLESTFGPISAYAYGIDETTKSYDIEFEVACENENGKGDFNNTISVNKKELVKKSTEFGEDLAPENWNANGSIKGVVKLLDFKVNMVGNILEGDKDYLELTASSDLEYDLKFDGSFEGNYKLCTIPMTFQPDMDSFFIKGLFNSDKIDFVEINTDINIYLVVTADGVVDIKYSIDDAIIGVKASKKEGVSPIKRNSGNSLEVTGNIDLGAGVKVAADLSFSCLQWENVVIADPSVYAGILTTAEINKINEGYEKYPPCVDLNVQGPIVKITYAENEEGLLYNILEIFNISNEFDVFTSDTAPIKKSWHVESDVDNAISMIEGNEENCTRIGKQPNIENEVNETDLIDNDSTTENKNAFSDVNGDNVFISLDKRVEDNQYLCTLSYQIEFKSTDVENARPGDKLVSKSGVEYEVVSASDIFTELYGGTRYMEEYLARNNWLDIGILYIGIYGTDYCMLEKIDENRVIGEHYTTDMTAVENDTAVELIMTDDTDIVLDNMTLGGKKLTIKGSEFVNMTLDYVPKQYNGIDFYLGDAPRGFADIKDGVITRFCPEWIE